MLSNGFATCSNDGRIKLWTNEGQNFSIINVSECEANSDQSQCPPFIYSIMFNERNNEIYSVEENGNCCIWKGFFICYD